MIRDQRNYDRSAVSPTLKALVEAVVPLKVVAPGAGTGADTTEDILASFSIPANTMGANGVQGFQIFASGTMAANANNKSVKIYFGALAFTTPVAATNNKSWQLWIEVIRTGLNTQLAFGGGVVDVTPVTCFSAAGTETETAAILAKVSGTNGTAAANDIICKVFTVQAIEAKKTT